MKLSRAEIRLAAESIACTAWERGASADQVALDIARAFRRDNPKAQEAAQEYAAAWLERIAHADLA